jgi:hypothetical protein
MQLCQDYFNGDAEKLCQSIDNWPYRIYRTLGRSGGEREDFAFNQLLSKDWGPMTIRLATSLTKPGDTHIVVCNADAYFFAAHRRDESGLKPGLTEVEESVAQVSTCVNGKWGDPQMTCDSEWATLL